MDKKQFWYFKQLRETKSYDFVLSLICKVVMWFSEGQRFHFLFYPLSSICHVPLSFQKKFVMSRKQFYKSNNV